MFDTLKPFKHGKLHSLPALQKELRIQVNRLPVSIRIVLESVLRNCDGKKITEEHVRQLAAWKPTAPRTEEIPFVVARIVLQDFTGVPLLCDLAAMRGVAAKMGKEPKLIEPLVEFTPYVRKSELAVVGKTRRGVTGTRVRYWADTQNNVKQISGWFQDDWRMTPDLTLQVYAQPFLARGDYSDVRELSATPRADRYEDRYQPYAPPAGTPMGFNRKSLRSNTVVRWEFRPGSSMFAVWTHGRDHYATTAGARSLGQEYDHLFELHPDNTFLVKIAYWLGRGEAGLYVPCAPRSASACSCA